MSRVSNFVLAMLLCTGVIYSKSVWSLSAEPSTNKSRAYTVLTGEELFSEAQVNPAQILKNLEDSSELTLALANRNHFADSLRIYAESMSGNQVQLEHLQTILDQAMAIEDWEAELISRYAMIFYHLGQEDIPSALTIAKIAKDLAKSKTNKSYYMHSLDHLAKVYHDLGDWDKTMTLYLESLAIATELNREHKIAILYNNIGLIESRVGRHENALDYYNKYLALVKSDYDPQAKISVLTNMGSAYFYLKRIKEAEDHFEKAKKLALELDLPSTVALLELWISAIYIRQKDYPKAIVILKGAADRLEPERHRSRLRKVYINLANAYIKFNKIEDAKHYVDEVSDLLKEGDSLSDFRKYHMLKTQILEQSNLWQQALEEHKKYTEFLTKISNQSKKDSLLKMTVKFETQQAIQDKELLLKEQELDKVKIENERRKKTQLEFVIIMGGLLLLGICVSLIVYYRSSIKYKELALRDALTGVPNRRAIMQMASEIKDRASKSKEELLFAILDVDFFKQINDRFGHDVGDEVLKSFANKVTSSMREQDCLGRIGGEEWLLILPNFNMNNLDEIFERLRSACETMAIDGVPPEHKITFSMGVVSVKANPGKTLDEILKIADEKLYLAKESGRNRYES